MTQSTFGSDHRRVSGLSGNEIFCLDKIGMKPGQLCIGNSVVAIGVAGGLGAGISNLAGGEVTEITRLVHDGRANSFKRMLDEAGRYGGVGLTGVSFDLINHGGNLEFVTVGSTAHDTGEGSQGERLQFSTSGDAQELYCQRDAGFDPLRFVFGNVAYSIGVGGNIGGYLRSYRRGEVAQFTEIFDQTRHLALTRITDEARRCGANAVVGIETTVAPIFGAQEMIMVGTAARHPLLDAYLTHPVTSDMTNEEMWNMASLGYLPLSLVMGVSVYSLGFTGGIVAKLKSLLGGEVKGLTEILYEAREKALARIERDAEKCGAHMVVGVKTRVYDLGGGLVEFMAIGTAVKKFPGATTRTPQLIPQAIIRDRATFVDSTGGGVVNLGRGGAASARGLQSGPMVFLGGIMAIVFFILRVLSHS